MSLMNEIKEAPKVGSYVTIPRLDLFKRIKMGVCIVRKVRLTKHYRSGICAHIEGESGRRMIVDTGHLAPAKPPTAHRGPSAPLSNRQAEGVTTTIPAMKTETPTQTHKVKSAYLDAEGWVLMDADGEPIEPWPEGWPEYVTATWLEARGIYCGRQAGQNEMRQMAGEASEVETLRRDVQIAKARHSDCAEELATLTASLTTALRERDAARADADRLAEALSNAEVWLANCAPLIEPTKKNPLPLPMLREVLAAHESRHEGGSMTTLRLKRHTDRPLAYHIPSQPEDAELLAHICPHFGHVIEARLPEVRRLAEAHGWSVEIEDTKAAWGNIPQGHL